MNRLKKWNWEGFCFMIILSAIAVAGNESVNTIIDWLIIMGCCGLPISLGFACITKNDE